MAKITKEELKSRKSTRREDKSDSLWMQHGINDVYYQRDALVTLWSVLGGIAVAALLTQVARLVDEIKSGNWHLIFYFFSAMNLITLSWVSHVWGTLVLKIRITILHTFLLLLNLTCISIICLYVTDPVVFFGVSVLFALLALLIQVYIIKIDGWKVFTLDRIKGIKSTLWVWSITALVFLLATAQLYKYPSTLSELIWGILAILASTGSLLMQHFGMEQERRDIGIP